MSFPRTPTSGIRCGGSNGHPKTKRRGFFQPCCIYPSVKPKAGLATNASSGIQMMLSYNPSDSDPRPIPCRPPVASARFLTNRISVHPTQDALTWGRPKQGPICCKARLCLSLRPIAFPPRATHASYIRSFRSAVETSFSSPSKHPWSKLSKPDHSAWRWRSDERFSPCQCATG